MAERTASRTTAKRTLVKSHQTARSGFSRPKERDQPAGAAGRPRGSGSPASALLIFTARVAGQVRDHDLRDATLDSDSSIALLDLGAADFSSNGP